MTDQVVLVSIPGLRQSDLARMPMLTQFTSSGDLAPFVPSFPCVTCPVQTNMTTGRLPTEHGVIANGFYWRDKREVEMWTAWNQVIQAPQVWQAIKEKAGVSSAVWFPLLSKGAKADLICTPAPIHNPDGSESLWCYTQPPEMYGALKQSLGDFPLKHFWGPLANLQSSQWIADSAVWAHQQHQPGYFHIYLPHLDYAAQKQGPDSPSAHQAAADLDSLLGALIGKMNAASTARRPVTWLFVSEYVITEVNHVLYPNRMLRQAGLLKIKPESAGGELLDFAASDAWALADHQFSHIFIRNQDANVIRRVVDLFTNCEGVDEVLHGEAIERAGMKHERSGEVILVSKPDSWQAYYYWFDDLFAPTFARTVDIHRKPGYDPVELHFDPVSKGIPLIADLIGGSHGAPARDASQRGVILTNAPGVLPGGSVADTDIADLVARQFGV